MTALAPGGKRAPSAREVALQVVLDVFGPQQRGAQAALDARARRAGLDARDIAFASELAYGSIKMRRLLDWYLAPFIGERSKPLPSAIVEILRLGIYQLRVMNGVDEHAAVFETVNLARRFGHMGTAGLVNAVLRRFIAEAPAPPAPEAFKSEDDFAAVRASVPTWLAGAWRAEFDGKRDALLAGVNLAPQHAVRVNELRGTAAEALAELAQDGREAHASPFAHDALIVAGNVPDDPRGRWAVQGEAACMPVDLLAPAGGETVLEFCSGRGNKTVQLASRMGDRGTLVCVERDERKVRVWREALERAGVSCAAIVVGDATTELDLPQADAVLLDAPCSGLGIIGRHPEARWRKSPDDPPRLALLQTPLLEAAASRTKSGGRLVYSVCSTDPREGRDVVAAFLATHSDFSLVPPPARYAEFENAGAVRVPPGEAGRDGFYIACLHRS